MSAQKSCRRGNGVFIVCAEPELSVQKRFLPHESANISRQLRLSCDRLAREREPEYQPSAMESLPRDVIRRTAVHLISGKRMTDMCHMHTYLMSSPRFEPYLEQ